MRRLRDWPYWLPTLNGAYGWCRAGKQCLIDAAAMFGFTRRHPPVIPSQREASSDTLDTCSTMT